MAQGHENKGNKTRKKKEIKDNKQRQNLGENYREKTAKMGGGTPHGASPPKSPGDRTPPPFHQ